MLKKVKEMPVPVAALIMVLCILVGITAGNKNALNRAIAENSAGLDQIVQLTNERANQAGNLLVLCRRNLGDDPDTIEALEEAIAAQKVAKRASKLAETNRNLTFAVQTASDLLKAAEKTSDQDKRLATGVMDEMTSTEKKLAREAVAYNNGIAEVERVYNAIPTRWLFGGPPEAYR